VNDVTELLALFMSQYQVKQMQVVGLEEQASPAPLDKLDAQLSDQAAKLAARKGIEHFVEFCRQFLREHPPETHIMLAQGFGVRLRGGYAVSLTPPEYESLGGVMENAPAIPVTVGMSSPGQSGIEYTPSFAVTGNLPHPGLRGPGA
jgi:hypothetical protein